MQRKEYTVRELVQDPSFRRMVQGTASTKELDRWNLWIEENDRNRGKAREAIAEIAGFEFDDPSQPGMQQEEWSRLYDATIGKSDPKIRYHRHMPGKDSALKWLYRAAAILILGGFVGVGIFMYPVSDDTSTQVEQITQEQTINTGTGEHKTVKFSNGSKIVINSNSSVTYNLGLLHKQTIEVTLEGEAYFVAKSDPAAAEPVFAIRTPDGIIRDIGTEFLVTVWDDRSRVVLQEGEVEVHTKNETNSKQSAAIHKGEMAEFNKLKVIRKQPVNPTFYTSWATGSMQFDETTIREFAGFLEQRFDVEVQLTDTSLSDITLDGAVYFKSLEELVRSVSEVAKIPVYQSEDRKTVYIGDNTRNVNN